MQITTIGLDIADVFRFTALTRPRRSSSEKQLRRGQVTAFFEALAPCLVGMEACADVAPFGARVDEARP